MRFPQKVKNRTTLHPAITLLGIYPKDTKILIQRDTCTPMFIAPLSSIAKLWKQPKCLLTDEWLRKMWYIYNGILLSHKKNEILSFEMTWMKLESIMLSKISQRKTNTI